MKALRIIWISARVAACCLLIGGCVVAFGSHPCPPITSQQPAGVEEVRG